MLFLHYHPWIGAFAKKKKEEIWKGGVGGITVTYITLFFLFVGTSGAEGEICSPCSSPSLGPRDCKPANTSYFTIYCGGRRRGTIKHFLSLSVHLLSLNALMLFMLHASEHPKAASEHLKTVYIYIHTRIHLYVYMHVFFLSVFSFH